MHCLLEQAERRAALTFSLTNKDGSESSSYAELPILLTPPLILITGNGFFASLRRTLKRVWVERGVVRSFGQELSYVMTSVS